MSQAQLDRSPMACTDRAHAQAQAQMRVHSWGRRRTEALNKCGVGCGGMLSLIHISEPTRLALI
eukprot:473898-Alexandrium_andersonii.AAC.1